MDITVENTITITPRITANPPVLQDIEVTKNGEYTADGSADGIGTVKVNVPEPNLEEKLINENGTYLPSEEYVGFSKVIVDTTETFQPDMEDEEIENIFDTIVSDEEQQEPSQEALGIMNEIWG